jgi:hypothetical protein
MFDRPLYYDWNQATGETYPVPTLPRGWSENIAHRRVERTEILVPDAWKATATADEIWISTVFLVIDHADDDEAPILFETMIFGMPEDHALYEYQERYATAAEARRGHEQAVKRVTASIDALRVQRERR